MVDQEVKDLVHLVYENDRIIGVSFSTSFENIGNLSDIVYVRKIYKEDNL